MTTVTIKSDSEKKTLLLMQFAKELGLSATASDFAVLDVNAMVKGIGRKATDAELIDYLAKGNDTEPISLEVAFSKYMDG